VVSGVGIGDVDGVGVGDVDGDGDDDGDGDGGERIVEFGDANRDDVIFRFFSNLTSKSSSLSLLSLRSEPLELFLLAM